MAKATKRRTQANGRDASGGLDQTKYLTPTEVGKLRRAVGDRALADAAVGRSTWVKNWMMVDLGLQTGLRVAEMTGLTVGDIDLKRGLLTVRAGKGSATDKRKRNATVPIGDNGFKRHLREYAAYFGLGPSDALFGVSPSALQKAFKKCIEAAGLDPRYSIHCLRHTLGTIHYAKHKNLRATQKLLRHSSISSTTIWDL